MGSQLQQHIESFGAHGWSLQHQPTERCVANLNPIRTERELDLNWTNKLRSLSPAVDAKISEEVKDVSRNSRKVE